MVTSCVKSPCFNLFVIDSVRDQKLIASRKAFAHFEQRLPYVSENCENILKVTYVHVST